MEDEKKCRGGCMYEAIYLRGEALDYLKRPRPARGETPAKGTPDSTVLPANHNFGERILQAGLRVQV